ncbi:hypothetical protein ONS95_001848 [Cadophora gregata]|uniref:uncharacterized protein n=1 Tax=Cadophora gregata TaxID=51156 RepID=UPI0026DA7AD9|nr:uncharacterized protein ONS95_001848 [Cadophora gregata]KAK0111493.1 hypothetical protein ONS95_001848 [Cadophora gregata]KAK0112031.1 hypothetical protein ONS96_001292 [Cadophora gregata f. sp. sojae]
MFPQNVRTLGQSFAAGSNWLFNFLVAHFTAQMSTAMGYRVYFFFASLMICSIVFVWVLLPETKGVPLESMDRLFSKDLKPRHAHRIVLVELKEDEEQFRHNVAGSGIGLNKDEMVEKAGHLETV